MKIYGICAILCFIVIYIDICDSKCDEYVIILEESSVRGKHWLKTVKLDEINWNNYSTDIYNEINGYKGCLLEFECLGKSSSCFDNIQATDHSTHSEIPGIDTIKRTRNRKRQKILDEAKIKINSNISSEANITENVDTPRTDIEVTIKNCSQKDASFNATKIESIDSLENKSRVSECEMVNHTYENQSKNLNYTVNEEINTSMYDVNIIYANEDDQRDNKKNQNNTVFCDYAETVCINDKSPQNHSLSDDEYSINITNHDEITKTLKITLNRDQKSMIQPIFTGYFYPIATGSNFTNYNVSKVDPMFIESKSVTITCKLRDNWDKCERIIGDSSIKDANNTPEYRINLYLKTNYVQNNTKTKYSNCTKDLDNTDSNSINVECDATEFAKQNPQILLPPEVSYNTSINYSNQINSSIFKTELNDLLIWSCQIMDLNYTDNTTLFTEQSNYDIIYLKKCSSGRNASNKNHSRDTLLTTENKDQILDNITTNDDIEFNDTKISLRNNTLNQDILSVDKAKNIIKMHIVTENRNNCSQNSTFSFIEGKIIDLAKDLNKENILEYDTVELKVSNCIDDKYLIKNNTQTHQQTELDIIFSNSTNNTFNSILLNRKHKESNDSRHIILQCLYPSISTDNKTKIILECESIDRSDFNYTDLVNDRDLSRISDTSNNASQKNIAKEKVNIDGIKKSRTPIDAAVVDKKNCTSNKTEHRQTLDCNSVELIECNNNCTSNETNSKIVENKQQENHVNDKDKSKRRTFNKTKGLGQTSLALEHDDGTEKILLIVILAITGVSILLILAIRKWPRQEQYNLTPTREPRDEEDTAL